jgi:hypothetical protein
LGEEISGWKDNPPAGLALMGVTETCTQLPVNSDKSYLLGVLPIAFLASLNEGFGPGQSIPPTGGVKDTSGEDTSGGGVPEDLALCVAINPCTHDYLFGFSGIAVEVPLPTAGVPLKLELSLGSLSVSAGGALSADSGGMNVWTLGGADSKMGTSEVLEMPAHLVMTGSGALILELEVAKIVMTGGLILAINWDPNGEPACKLL